RTIFSEFCRLPYNMKRVMKILGTNSLMKALSA
ncbi:hypothetical protein PSYMP_26898, partial [Pseudomonas amygdali pv. morsprunorum str. M302280]